MVVPKLHMDIVHVGHGDCAIATFDNGLNKKWTCIIDAGKGDDESYKNIQSVIKTRKIDKFNLAVLSHFDNDHIGGLQRLSDDNIPIDRYWSPYTPAIEKYRWLFGARGEKAVATARQLEKKLAGKNTIMESPTEGCIFSPIEGLRVKILSPPIKLYSALLMEKAPLRLLQDFDALLGGLVNSEEVDLNDESIPIEVRSMYHYYHNGLISRNISEEKESTPDFTHRNTAAEPEFFGNGLLNNTSLVIKLEVWTGAQWYSMLFPGDLENWLYLLAVRPDSLKSHFYKASHHGGRLYINGKKEANHEVMQTIRPNITVISANGQYNLPRTTAKYAMEKWGTSIFCTQQRNCEFFNVNGEKSKSIRKNKCCRQVFNCKQEGASTSFIMHGNRLKINKQACYANPGYAIYPVIQVEQHLIADSKILMALTEAEINKHTKWLLEKLEKIHADRSKSLTASKSKLITTDIIHKCSTMDNLNITESQINKVFEFGYNKGKLWMYAIKSYYSEKGVYKKATNEEIDQMCEIIRNYTVLIFLKPSLQKGLETLLLELPATRLFELLEKKTAFPNEMIKQYCWPLILKKIRKEYKYYYLDVKYKYRDKDNSILIMLKKTESPEKSALDYFYDFRYYERYRYEGHEEEIDRLLNGEEKRYLCSDVDKPSNKTIYELMCDISSDNYAVYDLNF